MDLREIIRALTAQAGGLTKAEQRIAQLVEAVNRQAAKLKDLEARLSAGGVEVTKFEKEERHEEPAQEEFDESADGGGY